MDARLARLLDQDPLGRLLERHAQQIRIPAEVVAPSEEKNAEIIAAWSKKTNMPPGMAMFDRTQKLSRQLTSNSREDAAAAAAELGVEVGAVFGFRAGIRRLKKIAWKRRIRQYDLKDLRKSGQALLTQSRFKIFEGERLPSAKDQPYIMLFSQSECFPCMQLLPTIARLSRYFDALPLYYARSLDLQRQAGIPGAPMLAGFFPEAAIYSNGLQPTTRLLWDTLNLIVEAGRSRRGLGYVQNIGNQLTLAHVDDSDHLQRLILGE